jgi:quinol monooxygenase YgiN
MLIVAGTMEIEPEQRDAMLAARAEGMRSSRSEAGCLDYVFSADPLRPGVVYLFERWESKEALGAHLERLRAGGSAEGPKPIRTDIVQYEIASSGPVGS